MKGTRLLVFGTLLLTAACGGTTTPDADLFATVNVVLSDDPSAKFAQTRVAPAFVHHKVFGQSYFHGRLIGEHQIAISRNGRDWITLGNAKSVDLRLQAAGESVELHADVEVPAGTYAYMRLTTRQASAEVESGAEVAGETLSAPVTLSLGEGDLVVETRLATPIFLPPGSEMTLAIDLNTEGWVSEENVATRQIPATDIETALSVTPHERLPALIVSPPERRI